jgi:signal transduction histidine kinase
MDIGAVMSRLTPRRENSQARIKREEPLRAELLRTILTASFIAIVTLAIFQIFYRTHGERFWFWFAWGTLDPALFLGLAAWVARKKHITLAATLAIVGLSHWAAFAGLQFGITDALLALTILVSGLLIGEYYVYTWTLICCAVAVWSNIPWAKGTWNAIGLWCAFYFVIAWLVNLFSRHLERLFEASRVAEEQQREAIVAERIRFAREIHDSLAQGFTGIVIQLNAAEQRLSDPEQARPHLDKARELARQSLDEARRSVNALRSGLLTGGNLLGAMEQIGTQLTAGSGIRFEAHLEGQPYALSEDIEAHLLRIGQEALTNAVRHAHPRQIDISLRYEPSTVALEIKDDGCGLESSGDGFGLKNMAERAGQLGGELRIVTQRGDGTRIMATVPSR